MTRVVVAGLGNELRGDDGVGPAVALRVAQVTGDDVTVVVNAGEPADLIELWRAADVAIVVDAMDAALEPGASRRFDPGVEDVASVAMGVSAHALPLPNVVALARALGAMPGRLLVFGVQGADFRLGKGLTPAVHAAVERLAGEILEEIGAALAP